MSTSMKASEQVRGLEASLEIANRTCGELRGQLLNMDARLADAEYRLEQKSKLIAQLQKRQVVSDPLIMQRMMAVLPSAISDRMRYTEADSVLQNMETYKITIERQ